MIQCPLCGFKFSEGVNSRCTTCPLNHGCNITCCPNCGYEMPPESKLVKLLRKWSQKEKSEDARHPY